MSEGQGQEGIKINGYYTEKGKKKFTLITGFLGAFIFFSQIIIPMAFMFLRFQSEFPFEISMPRYEITNATYWQNKIWFVESTDSRRLKDHQALKPETHKIKSVSILKAVDINFKQKPEKIADFQSKNIFLLEGKNELWIIGSKKTSWFKDGTLYSSNSIITPEDSSIPFLLEGKPAAFKRKEKNLYDLVIFKDQKWCGDYQVSINRLFPKRAIVIDKDLYIFSKSSEMVYFQKRSLSSIKNKVVINKDWKPAAKIGPIVWDVIRINNSPAIVNIRLTNGADGIEGRIYKKDQWKVFFSSSIDTGISNVITLKEKGTFMIISIEYGSIIHLITVKDGKIIGDKKNGKDVFDKLGKTFFYIFLINAFILFSPFLWAFFQSYLMKKYRVQKFSIENQTVFFAPLWKRALAQLIDGMLYILPILIGAIIFISGKINISSLSSNTSHLLPFILIGKLFLWEIIVLLITSFMEGRWGLTLGKWIFRIRVMGTDLKPCGFGRGLVRNLLIFIDGFSSFLVGVLVISLSRNWQRLGDMAANTIVVKKEF